MPEKKQGKVEMWRDRIEIMTTKRRGREDEWQENINLYDYEGNHFGDQHDTAKDQSDGSRRHRTENTDSNLIAFNLIRSNTKRKVPSLYFRNPKVLATPRRKDDINSAGLVEVVLNYTFEQIKLKIQMKRCITDALLTTMGVMKIGIDSEFRLDTKSKEDDRVENTNITPNDIWNLRVSPFDFYIDPRATNLDLSNAEYVVHKVDRFLQDVKDDEFYENTGNLKPNKFIRKGRSKTDDLVDSEISQDNREIITIWEIWDRKSKMVLVMAEGHDKFLKQMDWPWEMEGFPFVTLSFDYTPDELYPSADVDNYISAQKAVDLFLSIAVEHAERALPRIIVTGQVTDEEIQKAKQPLIDQIIHFRNGNVTAFTPPSLSGDMFGVMSMLREVINVVSGVNEFQRGQVPRGAKTATAATIINQSSQIVQSEQGDVVQDFFLDISRKDLQLMRQEYDIKRIVPIVGNDPGLFEFKEYNKDDIRGEYDLKLEPYSSQPRDLDSEKQQALQFVSVIKQLFPNIANDIELVKDLGKAFRKNNMDKIVLQVGQEQGQRPGVDPETENLIIATGGEPQVSVNDDHQQHIAIHQGARDSMAANGAEDFLLQKFDTHIQEHGQMLQLQPQLPPEAPRLQQIPGVPDLGLGGGGNGQFAPGGLQTEEQPVNLGGV